MPRRIADPIATLARRINTDRRLLKKQLREVGENYPLVMLAFRIHQATIAELAGPKSIEDTVLGPLYVSFQEFQASLGRVEVAQKRRWQRLRTCLMHAVTSGQQRRDLRSWPWLLQEVRRGRAC